MGLRLPQGRRRENLTKEAAPLFATIAKFCPALRLPAPGKTAEPPEKDKDLPYLTPLPGAKLKSWAVNQRAIDVTAPRVAVAEFVGPGGASDLP